jgi:N-dimethylarginine dimethylaminohydrolase
MPAPLTHPSEIDRIHVNVRSEIDPLKVVAMRWAIPYRTSWRDVVSVLSSSVREQLRHNAWTDYRYELVRTQQERLVQVLRDHGVTVLLLENVPSVHRQHYTRDIAFGIDDAFFVGRMGTRYREPEQQTLASLTPRLTKVVRLERGRIEGGDVMLHGDKVLVGLSEATDAAGVAELRRQLALLHSPREIVPIPFAHRGVIHLDTKFNIVADHCALFTRGSLLPDTLRWMEQHFDLIEATAAETRGLEINTVVLGGGHVIVSAQSERLATRLVQRGLTPIPVDYSEVTRWPGSFRCTTSRSNGRRDSERGSMAQRHWGRCR